MSRLQVLLVTTLCILLVSGPQLVLGQAATPAGPSAGLPDTPAGNQFAWILEGLASGFSEYTPDEVAARFSPELLSMFPAEQLVPILQQAGSTMGQVTFEGFTRPPSDFQLNALLVSTNGMPWVVPISVEPEPPHLITGINFAPVPPPTGVTLNPVADSGGTPIAGSERIDGFFDVGEGRMLYLSCVGTGSPTVVLESGLGDPAAPWFGVETAVAGFTRVCTYDRAGTLGGASASVEGPRTGEDAVADLHALLIAAKVPGPYVLVGHSTGGVLVRLFAHAYPHEVAGLVLVDSSHEDQNVRREALVGPELWEEFERQFVTAPNPEHMDLDAMFNQMRAAREAGSLPSMPLVVITAGQPTDPSLLPPGWPAAADAELWQELQADLAGLVPGGRQIIAEQSGHYVHQAQPDLVVGAIQQVVSAVRDPGTWSTPGATPVL